MVLTTPGEYVGPMVRTGWLQFPVVSVPALAYTTMRIRAIPQLLPPPTLSTELRTIHCNVLSLSASIITLVVQQTMSDQTLVRAKTIAGSTASVIKTDQTGFTSMANCTVRVGSKTTIVSSNTSTDITLSSPLTAAPPVGTVVLVWYNRLAVTTIPANVTINPGGFVRFTMSPVFPILEFYSSVGKDSVRIQLESNMRFEILPFGKEDPFYPQFITGPVAAPWPVPFGP